MTRATTLLSLVASRSTNNSGKALAEAAGLAVPTAHHLLATLTDEGFLAQDERARYLLGPKIAVLADALQRDVTPPGYLLSMLNEIAAETGETAYLVMWRRGDIQLVSVADGTQPVRVAVPLGSYHDAHARASGKLFLAHLDEDARDAYLSAHPLRRLTKNTITQRRRFLQELQRTRDRGYAVDEEEFQDGVSCISVPVFEDAVIIAGYTLSIPTMRYLERREALTSMVLEVAASATRARERGK